MAELLKEVYTPTYINQLSQTLQNYYEAFDRDGFSKAIFNESWEDLELKARMRHIAMCLNDYLPIPYNEQLAILMPASKSFTSYESMFFQDFVEVFGLDDYENSIKALAVFTVDSSSEFAIRQFLIHYEEQTLSQLKDWAQNENEHLRRLASEGCRPRLPWAIALPKYKKDPEPILEILELLKNDDSKYVQKSVANNLNDIAKDNPHVVINFVKENLGKHKSLDWICKHASRTLLKQGNQEILEFFNYGEVSHVSVKNLVCDSHVVIGETLHFSFDLVASKVLGNLRIEYAIEYCKANNKSTTKVFMIAQNSFNICEKKFTKKQSFKNMTTRKHYEGQHQLIILVNGKTLAKRPFIVTA